MNLQELATKPTLIKLVIDDEDTVAKYGEPINFWMYDRQDLDVYLKMATVDSTKYGEMVHLVNDLILDEAGNPAIEKGTSLPIDLTLKVVEMVVSVLGNTQAQTSEA